jgi:general secretion pathway protein H
MITQRWTRSQCGMTLVEMLAVLAIIGVAAGAVSLGIGAGSRASGLQAEAVRLAGRVQLAADQAMTDDRPVALLWDRQSYGFAVLDGPGRRTVPASDLLDRHRLPDGISLTAEPRTRMIPITTGDRDGALRLRLTDGRQAWDIHFDGVTAHPLEAALQ